MKYLVILVLGMCCCLGLGAEEKTHSPLQQRRQLKVERAKQQLDSIKKHKLRQKNLDLLSQIDASDLAPAVKLDNRYAALLEKRVWEERLIESELQLLYESVLSSASRDNGALPGDLEGIGVDSSIALGEYGYFPINTTNDLGKAGLLLFCRRLVSVDDEGIIYVEKGHKLFRMNVQAFEELKKSDQDVRLSREMRRMVPQVLAMTGEGKVLRLTKLTYVDVVTKANEARKTFGGPQVPMALFEDLFRGVNEGVYRYMQEKSPTTDKNGRQLAL